MIEYLKNIFLFDPKTPLGFTSLYFWIFFTIVFLGYYLINKNNFIRSLYLLLVSLFFYYKTSGVFFILLIFSTLFNYWFGNIIYNKEKISSKKIFLALSIFVNLLVLSYFKYTFFIIGTINHIFGTNIIPYDYIMDFVNIFSGSNFNVSKILLPAGISFYMFQTMSYTIDIYKNKIVPVKNIVDFGFFVSFFPLLVAGPILRASEFIPQIYKKFQLSRYEFGMAIFLILKGFVKKIMIGDYLAVNFIDRVFSNPARYSGFENFMATISYSLQVYMDFSAYSDIAIGIALLMGFRIPANFNSPYKAKNVGDFWKRWHISLSSWLKDYLYIPLGGNRNASTGTFVNIGLFFLIFGLMAKNLYVSLILLIIPLFLFILSYFVPKTKKFIITNTNLMITMLLGGLWHGSSWNFLIWGGLNGAGIVVYKLWKKISPYEKINRWWAYVIKIVITFSFITFTRIFFRAKDLETAKSLMSQIWNNFNISGISKIITGYYKIWIILILGFASHWLSYDLKNKWKDKFINAPHWVQVIIVVLTIFIVYQSICSDMQAFIYFQF
ncbi:MAG: MBOAT family protein [Bacteroidales bacterium]|jgi:D-alanyl-lipoteichoic acid acyltransferase DltB (MBOAT superfamily)|nr:MBOAT family protein [Bacteroidales bacterium]